ncbi:vesicle-associated membrane protein 2-like [Cydia splendana]|uniref:vesicle-associated membrane protein 2-like n=1 Tax=Cydia splendana TaxID=1100963 RepID=UPI0021444F08
MGKDKDKDAEAAAAPPPGPPGPPKPREPQYGPDGELLGGPHTMQQQAAQRRLQQTQAQVDEVVDIMKTNMDKVLERDHLISDLSERAEALEDGASAFKSQAASLKNKFWLENLKMMIIMGVIGLIIIGILYVRYSGGDAPAAVQTAPAAAAPVPAAPAEGTPPPAPAAGK